MTTNRESIAYPVVLYDTRIVPDDQRQGDARRVRVIIGIHQDNDGVFTSTGTDITIPWGQIGVAFSDSTAASYAPEDAERFWRERYETLV
jgi:hypothetical protein